MIGDFYIRLSTAMGPYTKGLVEATDEGEAFAEANKTQMEAVKASNESGGASFGLLGKATVGIATAFVGISAVSMKWATSFQSAMALLHTQAGVATSQLGSLGDGVLTLAGQVGFSPDSLAEALFHIESSFQSIGITGPQALNLLKVAAEGAAVGHANLVDVTNALDAAVASGIPGVQNFSQAMGVLNGIVGTGDMTMQNLADAFGTGLLANVKSFGLSITDVGAALAVLGDNNIKGAVAATDLRMAVQALAKPANTAATWLEKMGLSSDAFAKVMSKQGLLPALELLKTKMDALHISESEQGQVLTDMFGKKAGAGIVVLYDQLGRLQSKYPDLASNAKNFGDAWAATKTTVKQQLNEIGASIQAAGIRFGQFLLPFVSKGLSALTSKGGSFLGSLGSDFSQFGSGFMGKLPALFAGPKIQQPQLSGWTQAGIVIRRIADDYERFGKDVITASRDAVKAAKPVVQVIGTALGNALAIVGKVLANVVGPVLEDVFGFLASHQGLVRLFAEVILGGLIAKLLIIKSVNAASAITDFATSIVKFPFGQASQIGDAFKGFKSSARDLKAAVLDGFGTIKTAVTSAAGFISSGASKLFGPITDAAKKILPTKLDARIFLQSVKDLGSSVADTVKGWGSSIASAASDAATGLGNIASSAGAAIASFASNAWSGAMSALSNLGSAIATASAAAWRWVTATAAAGLSAARTAIAWTAEKIALIGETIATYAATAAQWLLDAAMDANPIGLIIIAIAALVAAFVVLWLKCAWFRDLWKGLWKDLQKAGADAWHWIDSNIVHPVVTFFTSTLPGALHAAKAVWGEIWGGLKDTAGAVWHWIDANIVQPVTDFFSSTLGGALGTAKALWDGFWADVQAAVQSVWNIIKPIFDAISSAVSGIGSALNTLGNAASSVGSTIGGALHYLNPGNWDEGGWVPGAAGAPVFGTVHGGEYVLSRDMIAGRAPIDNKVLTGMMSGAQGAPSGSGTTALAVRPGTGGATVVQVINVNVAGSVLSDQKLLDVLRTQTLRYNLRNSANGLSLA